jgi:hypothetical protein
MFLVNDAAGSVLGRNLGGKRGERARKGRSGAKVGWCDGGGGAGRRIGMVCTSMTSIRSGLRAALGDYL